MKIWGRLLACACALLIAGCATPESRIKTNPALFNSFPPDAQAEIRHGQIDVGFSKDMVKMALGNPDHIFLRKTAAGTNEVWSYVSVSLWSEPYPVESDVLVPDSNGKYRYVPMWTWVDVTRESERERLRVEFDGDKVKAIEHLK